MLNSTSLTKAKLEIAFDKFQGIFDARSNVLPMIRRLTSATPMGCTPGHLLTGINLQLFYASRKQSKGQIFQ